MSSTLSPGDALGPVPPPPPPSREELLEKVQAKSEPGKELLLSAWNLQKHFPLRGGVLSTHIGEVRAVDGVSFDVRRGETVGLVGESGCGKTTVGRLLLRLIEPTRGHTFYFDPEHPPPPELEARLQTLYQKLEQLVPPTVVDRAAALRGNAQAQPILKELDTIAEKYSLYRRSSAEMRRLRGKMQIVFQDPFSSLSPRMLVRDIVSEPLAVHHVGSRKQRYQRVAELLASVGLNPEHVWRFPHEFSGGQRQRIGIARALALRPDFIVLDEPTSALDVSVQAQILNILLRLQREQHLSYLFISHHLSVVRAISHRVVVMYLGKVVEKAPTEELFENPLHPYTQALLSAIPIPDPSLKRERIILSGDVPSPAAPPSGCRFHTRCPKVMAVCSKVEPPLSPYAGNPDHQVACHLYTTESMPGLGLFAVGSPAVMEIPARGGVASSEVALPSAASMNVPLPLGASPPSGNDRVPPPSSGPGTARSESPSLPTTPVLPAPAYPPAPSSPSAPEPAGEARGPGVPPPLPPPRSRFSFPVYQPATPARPTPPPEAPLPSPPEGPAAPAPPPEATEPTPPAPPAPPAPPVVSSPIPTAVGGRRSSFFASYRSGSPGSAPAASPPPEAPSAAPPPPSPPPAPTPSPSEGLPSVGAPQTPVRSPLEPPAPSEPVPPWRGVGKLSEDSLQAQDGASSRSRSRRGSSEGGDTQL